MSTATMNEMDRLRQERDALQQQLDAALEREAALAAHVELLTAYVEEAHETFANLSEYWNGGEGLAAEDAAQHAQDDACDMLDRKPDTDFDSSTLTRRDLIKQAEALELVNCQSGPQEDTPQEDAFDAGWDAAFELIRQFASELRQRAAAL